MQKTKDLLRNDPSVDATSLFRTFYDSLFEAIFTTPRPDYPAYDPERTLLQLVPLGYSINSNDFKNMRTPTNPEGTLGGNEIFAEIIGKIPTISSVYNESDYELENVYRNIMNGIRVYDNSGTDENEAKKKYEKAQNAIYDKVVDPEGAIQLVPNKLHSEYLKYQADYDQALYEYNTKHVTTNMDDPKERAQWQEAEEKLLRRKVENASQAWDAHHRKFVKDQLDIMKTTYNNARRAIFADAKQRFEQTEKSGAISDGNTFHVSYGLPTNWSEEDSSAYVTIKIRSEYKHEVNRSTVNTGGGGAFFSTGLWNIGGSFTDPKAGTFHHLTSKITEIEFKYCIVRIVRNWFENEIFTITGWDTDIYKRGDLSRGELEKSREKQSIMPLYPRAFIVANGIRIRADWTEEEKKKIETESSRGVRIGIGPFQISGRKTKTSTEETFTSEIKNGVLEVPGTQIIGFINTIVPFAPTGEDS